MVLSVGFVLAGVDIYNLGQAVLLCEFQKFCLYLPIRYSLGTYILIHSISPLLKSHPAKPWAFLFVIILVNDDFKPQDILSHSDEGRG